MIAAVELPSGLCVVKWVGRVRLHAGIVTYCGKEADASDGTVQVPDATFKDVVDWPTVGKIPGIKLKPCLVCKREAKL